MQGANLQLILLFSYNWVWFTAQSVKLFVWTIIDLYFLATTSDNISFSI